MRTLCYIVGASYSGSTLLTLLLNRHSSISTVGELKARFGSELRIPLLCSCGRARTECPFWLEVSRRLEQDGKPLLEDDFGTYFFAPDRFLAHRLLLAGVRSPAFEVMRGLLLAAPRIRATYRAILERNAQVIDTVCEVQGGPIFLDSSKDAKRLLLLQRPARWDLKVLHLVRDGRGSSNSFMRRQGITMSRAARRWRWANLQAERMRSRIPSRSWLRVRYEDLARDPEGVLEQIWAFLEVDPSQVARGNFRDVEHHVLGNPMRLQSTAEIRCDETWRQALEPHDLGVFDALAGQLNQHYGYQRSV